MAKPDWGIKRTCQNCGARFYDLHRDPIVCPNCQATYDPERQPRARRPVAAPRPEPAAAPPAKVVEDVDEASENEAPPEEAGEPEGDEGEGEGEASEDEGEMEEVDSENEDLIEDTSDLGQDDDDIGEVIEHIDDDVEDKS